MGTQRVNWKSALQKHLNSLVSEAWLDYESSPQLRKAWTSEAYYKQPDQNQFNFELCLDLAYLLCDFLFPSCHDDEVPLSDASKSLLDVLDAAFGSIPGVCDDAYYEKGLLATVLQEHASDVWIYRYYSTVLVTLLTASGLREGYLRPLLSIYGIAFASLDNETRTMCWEEYFALRALITAADTSPPHLADLVTDIGHVVSAIDFDGQNVEAAVAEFKTICCDQSAIEAAPRIAADDELTKIISELTSMVGLDAVKREVISLANFIKVRRLREARNFKQQSISLHLVFSGSPGTGKTTIARLVAKLYKSLGVLSKGHLVETDRGGLVAGYIGHTALKTKEVVESALDGVLFVDEAYSLTKEAPWDFGSEAVETLLKLMEDYRDRLVVIVAGYRDEMAKFIGSNPGLQSRFTRQIEFQDYTAQEMLEIFKRNAASNNFELDPNAATTLLDRFRAREGDGGFGNGRGVRNVFEAVVIAHANRTAAIADPSDRDLTLFSRDDVATAIGPDNNRKAKSTDARRVTDAFAAREIEVT